MNLIIHFYSFLKDLFKSRHLLLELTKRDFKSRYLGSYLGLLWAFVQPSITILILWFVFQVGFKAQPVDDFPFILWIMSGMIPWFFFADGLAGATTSIMENSFLVKKVVFRVSILPIVKILSALVIHIFFIGVLFTVYFIYGYKISIYHVQILYYLLAIIVLNLGLSWATSSIIIFMKDMGQIVTVFLQFGFWLTPIFWSLKMVPSKYQTVIKLNPVYYVIEGYREALIYNKWFWENMTMTVYFWIIALSVFICGALLFWKLKPHFADVL
jgi:ABC-type polysaccharide/polyol phosphate export permease